MLARRISCAEAILMIHQVILVNHRENPIRRSIRFIRCTIMVSDCVSPETKHSFSFSLSFCRPAVSTVASSDDPWVFRASLSQLLNKISGNELIRTDHHHHHSIVQQSIDIHTTRIPLKEIICYFSLLEGGTPEQKLECKLKGNVFFSAIQCLRFFSHVSHLWRGWKWNTG